MWKLVNAVLVPKPCCGMLAQSLVGGCLHPSMEVIPFCFSADSWLCSHPCVRPRDCSGRDASVTCLCWSVLCFPQQGGLGWGFHRFLHHFLCRISLFGLLAQELPLWAPQHPSSVFSFLKIRECTGFCLHFPPCTDVCSLSPGANLGKSPDSPRLYFLLEMAGLCGLMSSVWKQSFHVSH